MSSKAQKSIEKRVNEAISAALKHHQYVSAIDVLLGMKLLAPEKLTAWRKGQVPYLESVVTAGLGTISRSMKFFRQQAIRGGLRPSETAYLTWGRSKTHLRFSKSGNPNIEKAYRTHFLAKTLTKKKDQMPKVGENGITEVGTGGTNGHKKPITPDKTGNIAASRPISSPTL